MKIIKVGAVWCPGCLVMKPRFAKIEKENPSLQTEYYDYDIDSNKLEKYNIGDKLPVFIFLDKNEKELFRIKGEHSEKELLKLIEENKEK